MALLSVRALVIGVVLCTATKTPTELNKPTIKFNQVSKFWRNVSNEAGLPILFATEIDDLILECHAPFPVQWNISGLISPPDVVVIQPPKRDLITNTFIISIYMNFYSADMHPQFAVSTGIACEMVSNYKIRNEVLAIIKGTQPFVEPAEKTIYDSTLIPCPTLDPTTQTFLYHTDFNGGEILVNNVTYNPTEGFRSINVFNGAYTCRKDSRSELSVTFIAVSTFSKDSTSDSQFFPVSDSIKSFSNENLEFKCSSKTKSIRLDFGKQINVTVRYNYLSKNEQSALLVPISFTKGKAVCIGNDQEVIKEWSYEFIDSPELYFDNYKRQIHCLSESNPRAVQTVTCSNNMQCQYMKRCLRNPSLCNFNIQKQFYSNNNEIFCSVRKSEFRSCASISYAHLNGLVQCNVAGLTKSWEFFVSLDFLRYNDWQKASLKELAKMDEVPEILYANQSTQFLCIASAYHFADSIAFEIEHKNGSRRLVESDENSNVTILSEEDSRKIDEFNVGSILNINLPITVIGIRCIVPWWNSTEFVNISRKFETRYLLHPEIFEERRAASEVVYTGHKNGRLICRAIGEPQPAYNWQFNGNNVSQMFPELTMSTGSKGEGNLEFSVWDKKYSGEYTCTAKNMIGESSRKFKVKVDDESISSTSVVYISLAIVVLLTLAVVVVALFIFIRRYKDAKELIRNLTDSEIDEFFLGKPELLTGAQANAVDTIDFLPYNEKYEIPIDDLQFDSSDQNLLGTGEFSYVVRGQVISKSRNVAIKISKPSSDVNLFKSILSEVKIMLYVGEHENIVSLFGVSTQGIRNRSVYIATEICELGSLDRFLLKSRGDFVNLIDANQQINMKVLHKQTSRLSTMDLIKICGQVARGMEYLSVKSVVHADLATRNILLTSDRVAKISDFGLSKKLYECNNYVKKSKAPLPWRWMAIESLTTLTFSAQSDVWSYGVTLFEIFTLGDIPFPNEDWDKSFITRLSSGMRMGRPKYSTQEIYLKIAACWEQDPQLRPSFTMLRSFFEQQMQI